MELSCPRIHVSCSQLLPLSHTLLHTRFDLPDNLARSGRGSGAEFLVKAPLQVPILLQCGAKIKLFAVLAGVRAAWRFIASSREARLMASTAGQNRPAQSDDLQ